LTVDDIKYSKYALRKRWSAALLLIIFLLFIVFGIKSDSSLGRLFIYKISFHILKDHWLTGIGIGQYPIVYKNYQAAYFEAGTYTIKELLLSDNNRFAFNDYFQFIIETGIIGIAILTFTFFHLYKLHLSSKQQYKGSNFLLASAYSTAIAILIAAFFTHIFDRLPIIIVFIVNIAIQVFYAWQSESLKNVLRYSVYLICIVAGCLTLNLTQIKRIMNKHELDELSLLTNIGYLREAEKGYKHLYPSMKKDPLYLFNYATLLANKSDYVSASRLLEQALTFDNNSFNYTTLGDYYLNLHQNQKAEYCYKRAINTTPNRLLPRYQLFSYYLKTGNLVLAQKTGQEILNLPVKIPSSKVNDIRSNTQKQLSEISTTEKP